jgi:hypothetical protein
LAAKPSHVGNDVFGLTYRLFHPMVYSGQSRGHRVLTGPAPSHHAAVGSAPFRGVRGS